ncbi:MULTISPECIES: ABC transporter substrate-binding protein [Halobacillus]|uniref:ABC transporter substrate-binding protein n=1 Tax=Halobacillus TaxID=45667 RepID=UPI00136A0ED8|nr:MULTISPECIES: iron-siderophore ABC transporter substrate-binding protein [Halobacillus]MYL31637.1 ABC transporter substrate-binding protein [Halobacillus halophilus]MYL39982.1 ABC transporter substrate-binding protein [Halobacillus litoralis]
MESIQLHKKWGLILLVLVITTLLAACGNEGASSEDTSSESTNADDSGEETNTLEIEHAMGMTTIEGTPEKVVTLYQGANDAITAFEVEPVGIVESWVEKPIYKYLRDDLEGTTLVGEETQPNLEEIAKLNPDVIFASKLRHEEIYEKLNKIAPTIAIDQVYDFKGTVDLMGQTLNKEDKAEEIMTNWDNRIEDFKAKASEKLGEDWPLNVSILNFRSDHARIYFDSFAGSILKEAGFTRPENQQSDEWGMKLTDKESISEMNADVFYIFMSDEPAIKDNFEEWTNHPLWKNLDAVKNDEVHMVDEVTWNMAGGIRAANLMLDDLYKRFDLEK